MRNKFLILLVFTSMNAIFGQDSNFSVSMSYPLTNGENYFDRNDGLIDLGAQYRFLNAGIVDLGISVNASFFSFSTETDFAKTTEKTFVAQPRFFAELNIPAIKKLKPIIGIGYVITSFKNEFSTSQNTQKNNTSSGGLNLNLGLSYYIFQGLFVQAQYDYLKTIREVGTVADPDEEFYQKIRLIKIGVGYRF